MEQNWRIGRRKMIQGTGVLLAALYAPTRNAMAAQRPRLRVIIDNDFSGDPDGLFQLAHHVLCPSVEIPFVIGSHIHVDDFLDGTRTQADNAVRRAQQLFAAMELPSPPQLLAGRNEAPRPSSEATASAATERIISEALRTDTDLPLVYAAGAGLTELAQAIRLEPVIGERIRLVWIGGNEWPQDTEKALIKSHQEYNLTIDLAGARTIFNDSKVEIWQVPRDVYRQMIVPMSELHARLSSGGKIGEFLLGALDEIRHRWPDHMGETYILGDSPLVTLTALMSSFEPDSSSSAYTVVPTPKLLENGSYAADQTGRPMRLYRSIDAPLTLSDFFAKLATL